MMKLCRNFLFTLTLLLSFSIASKGSTWNDPFWNDGLTEASLIATGRVASIKDARLWITLEKVT